ncbi:LysR family transcriptional regulator [Gallibacterium sp. AGMB14963]|uniref:LysR family transcriptional regulator n=1 Tax=Gallibacterium faecale TaxID=3019086 RepID=UPI0022F16DD4|nr:LysR family transcriptional regulator [Gallibacterium sp. AGMB14963]MDA3979157.1 LysR family transcriptional regulator [Gallibacterium sp. AGMB14963]
MEISYRQLKAFTLLVEEKNMQSAAEKCFITQSALSQSMKRLSEQLGCPLFIRQDNKLVPTEKGKCFYLEAKEIVGRLERFKLEIDQSNFTISSLYSLAASFIPMAIFQIQKKYLNTNFILLETKYKQIEMEVRSGIADIGVTIIDPNWTDLEGLPLFNDHLCFICNEEHPLAMKKEVSWEEVYPLVNISVAPENSIRYLVDETYQQLKLDYSPQFNINRAETIIGMVQNNLGCSILSSTFAFLKQHEKVKFIPLNLPKVLRTIGIIKRKGHHHPMIAAFHEASLALLPKWDATINDYIGPIGKPSA